MANNCIHLGSFYWAEEVIPGVIANQFDFSDSLPENITVLSRRPLCECGNYGTEIVFTMDGENYSFNFLTGYPCQCDR